MSPSTDTKEAQQESISTFEAYKEFLAQEFPRAVQATIESNEESPHMRESMMRPAEKYFQVWGYSSVPECWEAAVPSSQYLNLFAWSHGRVSVKGWCFKVSAKAFYIMPNGIHLEVFSLDGRALPITETGYRSYFVPLAAFDGEKTIEDFMEHEFREVEPLVQMSLF